MRQVKQIMMLAIHSFMDQIILAVGVFVCNQVWLFKIEHSQI